MDLPRMSRISCALVALVFALSLGPACARPKPPPPDPDGKPEQAQPLALDTTHPDTLWRAKGDLDDWFRLEIPSKGTLRVTTSGTTSAGPAEYAVALTDASGQQVLVRERAGGRDRFSISLPVESGTVLLWIGSQPETTAGISYEVRADFEPAPVPRPAPRPRPKPRPAPTPAPPPPPPPAPKFDRVSASVVETSKAGAQGQTLTLAAGENRGVRAGLGGRLVEGGRVIGTFTVTEVYTKGCKVRVNGSLSGPVTSETTAEIDVPAAGSP